MIIGVAGACRKSELTFLRLENLKDEESYIKIRIPNTKTHSCREFAITKGDIEGHDFLEIIRKYMRLRPKGIKHDRFFVKYAQGKCYSQPIGINTFGMIPKNIAKFLKLSNPELFTGHCFRRSSATLLANSGADLLKIKQHGGWKSNTVAEGYVENSIENKKRIANNILGESGDIAITTNIAQLATTSTSKTSSASGVVNLSNCSNCVVNIYN